MYWKQIKESLGRKQGSRSLYVLLHSGLYSERRYDREVVRCGHTYSEIARER